ncbi:MAG TPA: hypothetical protein VJN70_19420 [Gemmatimonadaceae bacterium]|nr:hypothetical protein [Gemmatimonadaceae bacterium]
MQTLIRYITALSVLGAAIACGPPRAPLLTGERVMTTPGARNVDALWMMALPPVVASDDTVRVALSEWKVELSRASEATAYAHEAMGLLSALDVRDPSTGRSSGF